MFLVVFAIILLAASLFCIAIVLRKRKGRRPFSRGGLLPNFVYVPREYSSVDRFCGIRVRCNVLGFHQVAGYIGEYVAYDMRFEFNYHSISDGQNHFRRDVLGRREIVRDFTTYYRSVYNANPSEEHIESCLDDVRHGLIVKMRFHGDVLKGREPARVEDPDFDNYVVEFLDPDALQAELIEYERRRNLRQAL